jgi:hypothetical protein
MATLINLQEPILESGISSINYFTGRLLTASDLSREKAANREADRRLGRALGEGVAYGLEVRPSPESKTDAPLLRIEPGLAVNRMGQTLSLRDATDLTLIRKAEAGASGSSLFIECQPIQTGTYIAGQGVYLLTIAPAESRKGRALVSGLGNEAASCNTDTIIESVQFRLIQIDSFLDQNELQDEILLRNRMAYRCFGANQTRAFPSNPFSPPLDRYGLLDELRNTVLTDCDTPLAVIYWTLSGGIEFVDMWAARRRLTSRAHDNRWQWLTSDRRLSEAEAGLLQFEDQIRDILDTESGVDGVVATDRFEFLPPVGWLPIKTPTGLMTIKNSTVSSGFSTQVFFGTRASRELALLDAAQWRSLFHDALSHEPVDLRGNERLRLYLIWENVQAVESGAVTQLILVFASPTLPYRGVARFGYSKWDLSRVAPSVI